MPYFSNETKNIYSNHCYPKEIIRHVVRLYHRFTVSFRDIEDTLAYCRIQVSYESIRQWCLKFEKLYARKLKKKLIVPFCAVPNSVSV